MKLSPTLKKAFMLLLAGTFLAFTGCELISSSNPDPSKKTTYTVTFITGTDEQIETATVESGTLIKDVPGFKDELKSEDMNFKNWTSSGTFVNPYSFKVTKDITLTAQWTVSVTLNPNGGKFSYDNSTDAKTIEVEVGKAISPYTVEKTSDTNTKYTFCGWSLQQYEDNEENPTAFNLKEGSSKHITLYAYYSSQNFYTVNFYKGQATPYITKNVASGTKLSSIIPSNPSYSYCYFLYWSESEENEASALASKCNVQDEIITRDMNIYAIYTPKLASIGIDEVSNGSIKIKLYDPKVYMLKDGKPAGISITYSMNGGDFIELSATDVNVDLLSSSMYGYVTYSFQDLSEGTYTFKVTNGKETSTKTLSVFTPKPATELTATTDDSYAKITWTKANGYDYYTVTVTKNGIPVNSKSKCTTSAEFIGLENNTEYTFTVTTEGTDKSATITATPRITKKTSDYLVVLYMDGDNNLNDAIFLDLNEAEYGLYQIRNTDGTPKTDYASVNVVALWDGWSTKYNPSTNEGAEIGKSGSYIYEVGTDSGISTSYTTSSGCVLSSTTKDLSYTAPWLIDEYGNQEVDMSSKETLKKFYDWVNDHYESDHIILQFSNHGAGPRSINPTITLQDGTQFHNPDSSLRRAMCQDESNGGEDLLLTKDIPWAIAQSNIGNGKVDLILEDVCLGGSVEEAYELRNSARYLVASPNNVPARGFDYVNLMKQFTKANLDKENGGIIDVGNGIIEQYRTDYRKPSEYWAALKSYIQQNYGFNPSDEELNLFYTDRATLTLVDLSKMDEVKEALDIAAEELLNFTDFYLPSDSSGLYYDETLGCVTQINSVAGHTYRDPSILEILRSNYTIPVFTGEITKNHVYYQGSFSWLHDCGELMKNLKMFIDATELNAALDNVKTALGDAIVTAWADGYVSAYSFMSNLYYIKNHDVSYSDTLTSYYGKLGTGFGLTISGELLAGRLVGDTVYIVHGPKPDFYDTDLAFGKDSKWSQVLSAMFGVAQ